MITNSFASIVTQIASLIVVKMVYIDYNIGPYSSMILAFDFNNSNKTGSTLGYFIFTSARLEKSCGKWFE